MFEMATRQMLCPTCSSEPQREVSFRDLGVGDLQRFLVFADCYVPVFQNIRQVCDIRLCLPTAGFFCRVTSLDCAANCSASGVILVIVMLNGEVPL